MPVCAECRATSSTKWRGISEPSSSSPPPPLSVDGDNQQQQQVVCNACYTLRYRVKRKDEVQQISDAITNKFQCEECKRIGERIFQSHPQEEMPELLSFSCDEHRREVALLLRDASTSEDWWGRRDTRRSHEFKTNANAKQEAEAFEFFNGDCPPRNEENNDPSVSARASTIPFHRKRLSMAIDKVAGTIASNLALPSFAKEYIDPVALVVCSALAEQLLDDIVAKKLKKAKTSHATERD